MRKVSTKISGKLLCGLCSFFGASYLCAQESEVDTLRKELTTCLVQRKHFLQGADRIGCLPKLCELYKKFHQIEQKAQVTPIKQAQALAICELAQAQTELQQNKLCADLATLDQSLTQFRQEHHTELSALDRRMLELSKTFLKGLSPEDRKRLEELNTQYRFIQQRLLSFGEKNAPNNETVQRQDAVLDVLFL